MTTFSTTREFAATPAEIFAALRDPERLARWWGPSGFSNRFKEFHFKDGGKWVFDMVGPDGAVYPNESVFASIVANQSVVIDHVCQPFFRLTIALEPVTSGTLLRWDQTFADATVAQAVRHIVEPANEQNLDRLAQELAAPSTTR